MWGRGPDGQIIRMERPAAVSAAPAPDSPPAKRAGLILALRLGFRDTYDHLGAVLLCSVAGVVIGAVALLGGQALGLRLFGSLPGLLPPAVSLLLSLVALALVGGPLTAGIYRYCRNAAARKEPEVFDLAWGFRRAYARSAALSLMQVFGGLILAGNCYFYFSLRHPVLVVLGGVFGYGFLFWCLMSSYQWPLLAEQEIPTHRVVKKSALLVLDNFAFTLGLSLVLVLVTALCWGTVIGSVLLWIGAAAMLQTQATRELLRKYDVLPPDPTLDPVAEETHELRGRGWHE
jgi:uncharacterized membrane protein YesL